MKQKFKKASEKDQAALQGLEKKLLRLRDLEFKYTNKALKEKFEIGLEFLEFKKQYLHLTTNATFLHYNVMNASRYTRLNASLKEEMRDFLIKECIKFIFSNKKIKDPKGQETIKFVRRCLDCGLFISRNHFKGDLLDRIRSKQGGFDALFSDLSYEKYNALCDVGLSETACLKPTPA